MKYFCSLFVLCNMVIGLSDIVAEKWVRAYGGKNYDCARFGRQTSDGGYIVAGRTDLYGGNADALITKLTSLGEIEWARAFGGMSFDYTYSVAPTQDGGYIAAGYTNSYGEGGYDFLVIKLTSTGELEWAQTIGGGGMDYGQCVTPTLDGGYVIAGYTASYGEGDDDFLVVKLNASGELEWAQTFGGEGKDKGRFVAQTLDTGYIVTGFTSYGAGNNDFLVIKLNASGELEWAQTIGGGGDDAARVVTPTLDGGYIITGYTNSYGAGSYDCWVVKLTSVGTIEWARAFGGEKHDEGRCVMQTSDTGYIVTGFTASYGGGDYDFLLIKLNSLGEIKWARTLGEDGDEEARSVVQTQDGGYLVAGRTTSYGVVATDLLVLKLEEDGLYPDCVKEVSLIDTSTSPDISSPPVGEGITPTVKSPTPDTSLLSLTVTKVCENGVEVVDFSCKDKYSLFLTPTPSKGRTKIHYTLPSSEKKMHMVSLKICDVSGRVVKTLVNELQRAGSHTIIWDAKSESKKRITPGIYFCHLKVGDKTLTWQLPYIW